MPPDWAYVHNFADPDQRVAISLPSGTACHLVEAMDSLAASARQVIAKALDSEDYGNRRDQIASTLAQQQAAIAEQLEAFARERGIQLATTGKIAACWSTTRPRRA